MIILNLIMSNDIISQYYIVILYLLNFIPADTYFKINYYLNNVFKKIDTINKYISFK